MTTRREILQLLPVATLAASTQWIAGETPSRTARNGEKAGNGVTLRLQSAGREFLRPLDKLSVTSSKPGRLVVRDGRHETYAEIPIETTAEFTVAGQIGSHSVALYAADGSLIDVRTFLVDCSTAIEDEGGIFGSLLNNLYWTMCTDGPLRAMRYRGEVFTFWDSWLMDNTQTLKGMKYFWPEVKSNVDFYARSQREDGMIWENFEARTPPESDWDRRFKYADFARPAEGGFLELRRAPVENHVEAFFLEALYFAWKACGETQWMVQKLDAALRAVHYSMSDPYRWSAKYELLKRGFTVDTWDFLAESEAARVDGDIMKISLKETRFGVFFGDNNNFIAGLRRLAEMLEAAGRGPEAADSRAKASAMEDRLNRLAWNGEFFTHWVPEDRDFKLDLGVDMNRQVALSNSYALNRNASHEQAIAIIRTYQRIRREMPASSPGEFYAIYPPFERGFGAEDAKWEYMNGGVMSCVAGELARGSFDHGFEAYGVDILRRQQAIAERYRGVVPAILRGKVPEPPARTFTPLDLRALANVDFGQSGSVPEVQVWTGEGDNDLRGMPVGRQVFRGIPFDVIDPALNRRRACVALSSAKGFKTHATLSVDASAGSFYLLHASSGGDPAGKLTVRYADGSSAVEYMRNGANVGSWWAPRDLQFENQYGAGGPERMQVAWRGANPTYANVGVYVTGFANAHPERKIAALELDALETGTKWMVLGATLSDAGVFLPPWNDLSNGMPNNWGAAALVFALLEGLSGVKDTGMAFDRALVAPRWSAGDVKEARVCVRYPASRGYVLYHYRYNLAMRLLAVELCSSAEEIDVRVLLPEDMGLASARMNGIEAKAYVERVEGSAYARLTATGKGPHRVELQLAPIR